MCMCVWVSVGKAAKQPDKLKTLFEPDKIIWVNWGQISIENQLILVFVSQIL